MMKKSVYILLLCLVLLLAMSNLCAASLVEIGRNGNFDAYAISIDPQSIQAREYKGRKYLEFEWSIDFNPSPMSQIKTFPFDHVSGRTLIDIENSKFIVLDIYTDTDNVHHDIAYTEKKDEWMNIPSGSSMDVAYKWLKNNYQSLIQEIKDYNSTSHSHQVNSHSHQVNRMLNGYPEAPRIEDVLK